MPLHTDLEQANRNIEAYAARHNEAARISGLKAKEAAERDRKADAYDGLLEALRGIVSCGDKFTNYAYGMNFVIKAAQDAIEEAQCTHDT